MPPLPEDVFAPGALAYDMVYGRRTPFLEFARGRRARAPPTASACSSSRRPSRSSSGAACGRRRSRSSSGCVEKAERGRMTWTGKSVTQRCARGHPSSFILHPSAPSCDGSCAGSSGTRSCSRSSRWSLLQFWFVVHIWYWADHNPETTAFMRARLAVMREDEPGARLAHQWVPYARISVQPQARGGRGRGREVRRATRGFDWEAIQKAHERNLREGRDRRAAPRPSPSSSRRTCSCRASAPGGARRRRR